MAVNLSPISPMLLMTFIFLPLLTSATSIGVTYRHPSAAQASPEEVAATLKSLNISSVRLTNPDPTLIRAFSNSNFSLLLSIPNSDIPTLAANHSNAAAWLSTHVSPFYPGAHISTISVGSDVGSNLSHYLLPAMSNINFALHELGIRHISVSTTFSLLNILNPVSPPSAATFQQEVLDAGVRNLLDFLELAHSPFLINLQLFNLYRLDHNIPTGFALFQEGDLNFREDLVTGLRYWNLFDTMVDALASAMEAAGYEDIPIVITEIGWPNSLIAAVDSDETTTDATMELAEIFLRRLVKHLRSRNGTPMRQPDVISETYIFELVDGEPVRIDNSDGSFMQFGYGILYLNLTSRFSIDYYL